MVLRRRDEYKRAKGHSAEFRQNVTVPKHHYVNVIKCRTVKVLIL
jgi:hypothetical protein